jgi:cystathionine beta-lyase
MPDKKTTGLIHHPYVPPAGFESVPVAVHKASTVLFPSVAALRSHHWRSKAGYTYGLHGTPTTFTLEERIATLEGGRHCVLAPSGLAAISMVNLALLKQGDEVLLPENAYGPARAQARSLLAGLGVQHRLYDPMDDTALPTMLGERTKLVWIEAPGSVTLEFPNLRAHIAAARAHGAVCAMDTTWAGGIAFNAFELGADLTMHALTKYPSGGADLLMGAVTTGDDALHEKISLAHMQLGLGVGANDAELVLRALPSLALRYAASDASARALAQWLAGQPGVAHVLHPALPGAPGHEHWSGLCTQAAGLFSVVFDPAIPAQKVEAFVEALKVFRIGESWGGPVSLAVPYDITRIRAKPRWSGTLVRFAIGLEAVEDLRADLLQAMESAFGANR